MHRSPSLVLLAAGLVACGSSAKQNAAPAAEAPAVIAAPLDVPKPVVNAPAKPPLIPLTAQDRNLVVSPYYSLMNATLLHQDGGMLMSLYHPDAVLVTQGDTIRTNSAIVTFLMNNARAKSVGSVSRKTSGMRILNDSTLLDSGTYTVVSSRQKGDSLRERGQYRTSWRARLGYTQWVVVEDYLGPTKAGKR